MKTKRQQYWANLVCSLIGHRDLPYIAGSWTVECGRCGEKFRL